MYRIVYDISHHQNKQYWKMHRNDTVILKCMNGTKYPDDTFSTRMLEASDLLAVYDYGYATTDMQNMGRNGRELYGGIHYLDIEKEYFDTRKVTEDMLVQDCIAYFNTTDRSKWYIYSGEAKYKKYFKKSKLFDGAHFWMARYPSKNYIEDYVTWLDSHKSSSPINRMAATHICDGWQFTSAGGDRSVWYTNSSASKVEHQVPTRVLKLKTPRMSGDDVKWVQHILGIEEDGKFGPLTDKAVRIWQSNHCLSADGSVGPKTREEMKKYV